MSDVQIVDLVHEHAGDAVVPAMRHGQGHRSGREAVGAVQQRRRFVRQNAGRPDCQQGGPELALAREGGTSDLEDARADAAPGTARQAPADRGPGEPPCQRLAEGEGPALPSSHEGKSRVSSVPVHPT
jgi:hypothetical protein